MTINQPPRFLFISNLAFYPIHWQAYEYLCAHYRIRATVIARSSAALPGVHRQLGWVDVETINGNDIRLIPHGNYLNQVGWLFSQLSQIRPDIIWIQEEPNSVLLLLLLIRYQFNRNPKIAIAVCENIFRRMPFVFDWLRPILWRRVDKLLATATPSIEGIRAVGFPSDVSAITLVAGALPPPKEVQPLLLPFERKEADFVIAFVGRICEEKGWKVLLFALETLPENYKCIMAGSGPQEDELQGWLARPSLAKRVFHLGLMPHEDLWHFYKAADCLVLPSLTTPRWKEQFGGVLADGMAMGLPIIGSDSGSIPEVIGSAGLIVPEGKPVELASALRRLGEDPSLRGKLGTTGRNRFEQEFAIPAYARKIARSLELEEIEE